MDFKYAAGRLRRWCLKAERHGNSTFFHLINGKVRLDDHVFDPNRVHCHWVGNNRETWRCASLDNVLRRALDCDRSEELAPGVKFSAGMYYRQPRNDVSIHLYAIGTALGNWGREYVDAKLSARRHPDAAATVRGFCEAGVWGPMLDWFAEEGPKEHREAFGGLLARIAVAA